jgi:hypothetical protein
MQRRRAIRGVVRGVLARALGAERARVVFDLLSACRELAWNSFRRRLYPSFWQRAAHERRSCARRYAIHGEFGDALLALPFLHRERLRHPLPRLGVVIKGERSGAAARSSADPLAEAGLRVMPDARGRSVSFLAEFWSRVPFLDEVIEGDVRDASLHYWQPQPAFTLAKETVGPSDYGPFLGDLFTLEDRRLAEAAWSRSSRPLRVAVHLRRSAEQIAELVSALDRSDLASQTAVALLGSRRHEAIPEVRCQRIEVIDLTDNYEKGIGIMPLLQLIRGADLFAGGRGGFELFALVSGTPALTVFDDDGWWEQRRLWPQRLWDENPLGGFVLARDFHAAKVHDELVAPWLSERLASRPTLAATGAAR